MRKGNGDRKRSVEGARLKVFSTFVIEGLNLDYFVNHLNSKGIKLYNVKKLSNKRLIVSVNYFDRKILFAIAKELCYNIKKVKDSGRDNFFVRTSKRLGLALGMIAFSIVSLVANDLILSIDFVGGGSSVKREITSFLEQKNVTVMGRFSSFDLNRLEDEILSSNKALSFVSCEKKGNRLVIELILSEQTKNRLTGNVLAMYAECDGEIESIKVYRGTAKVKKGDKVSRGDVLVEGYAVVKEQRIEMNVLAYVSLLCEKDFTFVSEKDYQEQPCLEFAIDSCEQEEVVSHVVSKERKDDKFVYSCRLTVRREYLVG